MMNHCISFAIAVALLGASQLMTPQKSYGGSISSSAGELVIEKTFGRIPPRNAATATGSVFAHAAADSVIGGVADFSGFYDGVATPGVAATQKISEGPLAGDYSGAGILNAPKLPNDHNSSGFMKVTVDGTTATGSGLWRSKDIGRAWIDFKTTAQVTRNNADAPPGTAVGSAIDPLILTTDEATDIHLVVTLNSVDLLAMADPGEFSAAQLETFGAFGFGSSPGANILAEWDFLKAITSNNLFGSSTFEMETAGG